MTVRLRAWAPAAAWAAVIFAFSSRPALPVDLERGLDKLAHFAAYALLGLLLARGAYRSGASPWLAVALGLLYGASDEIHQSFVPGRAMDLADWVADALGSAAGVLLFHRIRRTRDPQRRDDGRALADSTT